MPSRSDYCPAGEWLPSNIAAAMYVYDQFFGRCDEVFAALKWNGAEWNLVVSEPGSSGSLTQCSMQRSGDNGGTNNLTYEYVKNACVIGGGNAFQWNSCRDAYSADGGEGLNPAICCDGHGSDTRWEIQTHNGIPKLVGGVWGICYDCDPNDAPTVSTAPVRYATGELRLSSTDISSSGFSVPWGHKRSFVNQLQMADSIGQGYNWLVSQWSYAAVDQAGNVSIMGTPGATPFFVKTGNVYTCAFDIPLQLYLDEVAGRYVLSDNTGTVTEFDQTTGMFRQRTSAGGDTIAVTSMSSNGLNFTAVQRSVTSGGVTTIEQYQYDYITPYADTLLQTVTLSRQVGGGSWANVTQANYTYYGTDDANGGLQDLKTVITQVWDGSAWSDTGTTYYRYYPEYGSSSSSSSSSSGSATGGWDVRAHLLKYVLNPASYDRMVADGHDPLTATDSTLSLYADYYFEYDNQRRVTKETVKSGSQTYLFRVRDEQFLQRLQSMAIQND